MYADLLAELAKWRRSRGKEMQPPITAEQLERMCAQTRSQLGEEPPDAYLVLLRLHNGIAGSGFTIYACEKTLIAGAPDLCLEGFVDANLEWWDHEPSRAYLFLGQSGMSTYVFNRKTRQFEVRDRQSDSLIELMPSFEALVPEALEENHPPR